MKVRNHDHLQQEHILWAVIDESELAGEYRQHLRQCPVCKTKVEQLRSGLEDLGEIARQAVPSYTRPVRLPSERVARISQNAGWLPFFGAAAMAGLLVFFYFMGTKTMIPSEFATLQSQESLLEDESLMRQISEMVENPLSEDMYEISGENGIWFDDDFLQFVVPDIQDDFQS